MPRGSPCEGSNVRRLATTVLLITGLSGPAAANPGAGRLPYYDPDGAAPAPLATDRSPWLDGPSTQPSLVLGTGRPGDRPDRRLASALTLGALYAGFITWTYFAWYQKESRDFRWGGDGTWKLWKDDSWFGTQQYAAGADKMGHAWVTSAMARGGTELLHRWGGFSRLTSAIVATAAAEALFLGVEIKDGFAYRFSFGDFWFNTGGALFAFAQSMSPAFDRLVDFRVEYVPSSVFRERFADGDIDVAEDYSGQTYHLAFHLNGIPKVRNAPFARFLDVTLGFETRGYKPDPTYDITPQMPDFPKRQTVFLGLSLNLQQVVDELLSGRSKPAQKFLHGALEVFSVPYTTFRAVDSTRRPTGVVPDEQ